MVVAPSADAGNSVHVCWLEMPTGLVVKARQKGSMRQAALQDATLLTVHGLGARVMPAVLPLLGPLSRSCAGDDVQLARSNPARCDGEVR